MDGCNTLQSTKTNILRAKQFNGDYWLCTKNFSLVLHLTKTTLEQHQIASHWSKTRAISITLCFKNVDDLFNSYFAKTLSVSISITQQDQFKTCFMTVKHIQSYTSLEVWGIKSCHHQINFRAQNLLKIGRDNQRHSSIFFMEAYFSKIPFNHHFIKTVKYLNG